MLTLVCGNGGTSYRGHCLLFNLVGGDPPSAEELLHRLSVPGAHAVVDEDVEGGVEVGGNLNEPSQQEISVVVAASRGQLRHEGYHQPA